MNRTVPRRVARVVGRMLEKDPARRPPAAADAAALLAESLVPRRRWWPVAVGLVLLAAGGVWAILPPAPSVVPAPDPTPAPVVPDEPPLPADPDRAFAERALDGSGNALLEIRVGGEIRQLTTHPKGIMGPVDARADLPPGPFAVVVANLNRHRTFGDADAALLRGLRHVTILQLTNLRVTDDALPHLRHAAKLESLFLYATGVTDDGLPHLYHLAELRQLSLRQTRVTEAGVRRLSAALPRCRIEWNGGIVGPLE